MGQALGICRERVRQIEAEVTEKIMILGGPLAIEMLASLEVGLRWLFGGETLLLRVGRDEYDLALLVAGGTARKTTCTPRNSMASALRELRGGV
ncbi:MAG: hypothetical protein KC457_28050 [Myxococcales bacterium]|nr:hypothetical protein [Myxococcales bacterium]